MTAEAFLRPKPAEMCCLLLNNACADRPPLLGQTTRFVLHPLTFFTDTPQGLYMCKIDVMPIGASSYHNASATFLW